MSSRHPDSSKRSTTCVRLMPAIANGYCVGVVGECEQPHTTTWKQKKNKKKDNKPRSQSARRVTFRARALRGRCTGKPNGPAPAYPCRENRSPGPGPGNQSAATRGLHTVVLFPILFINMFLRKFELAFLHRGINKKKIKKRKSRQKKFGLSFVRSHRFSHQKNQKKKIKKKKTPNFARRTQSFPNC
jgi:hypothetical protein